MAVFPESMNKLNPADTEGSLRIIENYIRYMGERVEFSNRNMTRSLGSSEMTTLEVMEVLNILAGSISVLQSTVNGMKGDMTTLQGDMTTLRETITGMQETINDILSDVAATQESIAGLEDRVSALENPTTE